MTKILGFLMRILELFVLVVSVYFAVNLLSGAKISFEKPQEQERKKEEHKTPLRKIFKEDLADEESDEYGAISLGGYTAPDGTVVQIDFPLSEDIRNIGSRKNGYGMCTHSSIEMNSRWENIVEMRGFRDWAAQFDGGGYPRKIDNQIKQFCKEQGIKVPPYLQYQGSDLDVLKRCLKTYRIASVTYAGNDGVRYNTNIAHMVNLVHLDDKWAAIYDNNGTPGKLIWMSPKEFKERWTGGKGDSGNGWAFFWLAPPPPPPVLN